MEGKCKDCKYWLQEKDQGTNFLFKHLTFKIGCCIGPAEDNFDVRDMKADQMAVTCGHDGGITTGENFGCIHYAKS